MTKLAQCPNKLLQCLSLHIVRTYFLISKKYSYLNILTSSMPIALITRTVGITVNIFYIFRRRIGCCKWWNVLIRAIFYSIQAISLFMEFIILFSKVKMCILKSIKTKYCEQAIWEWIFLIYTDSVSLISVANAHEFSVEDISMKGHVAFSGVGLAYCK